MEIHQSTQKRRKRKILPFALITGGSASVAARVALALSLSAFLIACSSGTQSGTLAATPTVVRVNGFGGTDNHVHSLLALPGKVLILATHYGLFRSSDNGEHWTMVAAGPGQIMDGLMTDSLVSSELNQQRLYVLTQIAVNHPKGTIGLYTSADQGRTWKLAVDQASVGSIFFVQPGNDNPDEVYIYLPDLGPLGLKVSLDAGQHFSPTGKLPFARIFGLLAIPGTSGQLLVYGNDGMARSSDGGIHWEVIKDTKGGIFDLATSGPHSPIYASGDAGIYVSQDQGKSFSLIYTKASYGALACSPTQSQEIYGKTGTGIYSSSDGGHTWQKLPPIKGNLQSLAADPQNPSRLYLALSYPSEVYSYDKAGNTWTSLTPKP
ncbi:hypothetical protein EPA93_26175 [Ktedonosporobacter rubrisoli]|uniref:Sortilin N-terminal domain-containing protein n=1 Tax=Ktedonosporobacter rubrisoli TaxID=2509675 RepID=A0A4P6JUW0_KTERU|nr:hypothetical protein [Ktedonosporobacter rubrisoli]QBD79284.1 hypothetical protein EPA93_26175 [Ktedonosporobacter rubrisoli]